MEMKYKYKLQPGQSVEQAVFHNVQTAALLRDQTTVAHAYHRNSCSQRPSVIDWDTNRRAGSKIRIQERGEAAAAASARLALAATWLPPDHQLQGLPLPLLPSPSARRCADVLARRFIVAAARAKTPVEKQQRRADLSALSPHLVQRVRLSVDCISRFQVPSQ